ncbi:hypothetical protein [Beduini sp.]|uniref:hypothetical protein n=1 Tax=Beduini sp. TaxID=1922300 RepID=UPI003990CF7E
MFDEQNFEYEDIQSVEETSFKLIIEKGLYDYSVNNLNSLSKKFLVPYYSNKAYYKEKFQISECSFNSACVEQIFTSNIDLIIKK